MSRWQEAGLLTTALLCCVCGIGSCTRPTPTLEERYRQAAASMRTGDFERVLTEAEFAERRKDIDPQWRCRFRLLQIEALLHSDKPVEAENLLAAPPAKTSPEYDVRARVFRARRAIAKSDFQTAATLTEEAQRLAENLSRPDLQAEADIQMGHILGRQRQYDGAEAIYQRALTHASKARDAFRQASAMNNVGMVRMLRSRCDEALGFFDKAEDLWQSDGAEYWAAIARGNTAVCYQQLGDFDKALEIRKESLGLQRPGTLKANALGEMGTLLLPDDPQKAIPYYREARDMARQFGAQPVAARWAVNLTVALGAVGDWIGADKALAEARQLQPEPRSRTYLELNAAAIALGLGRVEDARVMYESILKSRADEANAVFLAHAGLANVWMTTGNTQVASRHFESAIDLIENAWSELNSNEYKITFLASLIRFYQAYVDALMTQGQEEKALAVADRSRARLLAQRLSRKIDHTSTDFRIVARESHSVWLCYWLAPKRSFLWVVTPAGIRSFSLPPAGKIEPLVREYRGFIESAMRDPMATPSEAGRALYEMLVAPVSAFLAKNADVVIVPDGPLHQLSFDTLPVDSATSGAAHYLMDDYSTSIAPSLGIYRGEGAPRRAAAGRAALIVGDPISPGPAFPSLPHAPVEIATVRKRLSAMAPRIIVGEAARPDIWVTANPGKYSVIHIAAHAEANEKSPLLSAIILSPSSSNTGPRLFARDLIDVPLQAELVTLSACRSSGARAYRGEGLVGFVWAFLQAGAHSVVAGLWDVADESTSALMDSLYEGIARRESPPRALRAARLALRKGVWSKPFYWGPFQCYVR